MCTLFGGKAGGVTCPRDSATVVFSESAWVEKAQLQTLILILLNPLEKITYEESQAVSLLRGKIVLSPVYLSRVTVARTQPLQQLGCEPGWQALGLLFPFSLSGNQNPAFLAPCLAHSWA